MTARLLSSPSFTAHAAVAELLADPRVLFVVNHSGGKDSQAMMVRLVELVPASRLVVVHASLGDFEWPGALELAEKQAADAGVPFLVARAVKTFEEMVERRHAARPDVPSFPSASTRQCTSDLKRGPIEREIRRYVKAHGFAGVVSCHGIRAEESPARAKQPVFEWNERATIPGRTWFDWHPIAELTREEVFATIAGAGQEPHAAYALGNDRLSCVFCIMGSKGDIANGARQRPELFARLVRLERRTGYTMHQSRKSLEELAGVEVPE